MNRTSTDSTMRAIRLRAPGELVLEEIERPRPEADEALVRVHAAAITRDELDWPVDRLPAIPSYELSGMVDAVGADAGVAVGDAVYALTPFDRDGVAAEYAAVPASLLAPKPRSLSHVESAAVPLAGLSAWQGLFEHGRLEAGQRVLIHGAGGGVGHLAVQLARRHGAYVIGTASHGAAESLGVDALLDATADLDLLDPVDLVFDTAGGDRLARSAAVVRPGGRVVSIAEEPPPGAIGAVYFVVEPNREQLVELAALVDGGDLRPAIDSVFPLAEAPAAFARSMSSGKNGKVVLSVHD